MVALKEEELRKLREATQLLIEARVALEGARQDLDGKLKHVIGEMDSGMESPHGFGGSSTT